MCYYVYLLTFTASLEISLLPYTFLIIFFSLVEDKEVLILFILAHKITRLNESESQEIKWIHGFTVVMEAFLCHFISS